MIEGSEKRSLRNDLILDEALKVFGRQGYKKTSVEDIASAAGLSKQGLYLYFSNKQDVLSAALEKYLNDSLRLAQDALDEDTTPLGERLYAAMDSWFGRHFEIFKPQAFDIIEVGNQISPKQSHDYKEAFIKKIAKTISISDDYQRNRHVSSPREIAEVLFLCGLTWKEPHESRRSFMATISKSICVCCHVKMTRRFS